MAIHNKLRLVSVLVTCAFFFFSLDGFVMEERYPANEEEEEDDVYELSYLNKINKDQYHDMMTGRSYRIAEDDDDDDDDGEETEETNNKRDFSPEKLRQQVRDKMEDIMAGRDEEVASQNFDSMLREMIKEKEDALRDMDEFKEAGNFVEEHSTQSKIETNGNEGVAVVTGQSMQSSSTGNGSSPLMKVAKVVAVATKDGNDKGGWKMKPIEEEVKVITPSPIDGADGKDGKKERMKGVFEGEGRDYFGGEVGFRRDDDDDEDGDDQRQIRKKRSLNYENIHELKRNPKQISIHERKESNVDLLKNYIALQDAENRHLMQALDLASEIELRNGEEGDESKTVGEQMYHMRKALEDERSLSDIRKEIQLSIQKPEDDKRSSHVESRIQQGEDLTDDENEGAESFLGNYMNSEGGDRVRDGEEEEGEGEDEIPAEEYAEDIALNRHKLRNEELMDRLAEVMSQSEDGWEEPEWSSKLKRAGVTKVQGEEVFDEETLRRLLKAYRLRHKNLDRDNDLALFLPAEAAMEDDDDGDDEGEEVMDDGVRRRIMESLNGNSYPEYVLNPFYRDIMRVDHSNKRFFQESRPMTSAGEGDEEEEEEEDAVENIEPWCSKAADLVNNCLDARMDGLLPDSEAVDLCNAHHLCYICGSSNGVTAEECDRAFMERSKELCLDEMSCKKQAASLYVTVMAKRKFYDEYQAPDVCTDPCVTGILYNDKLK